MARKPKRKSRPTAARNIVAASRQSRALQLRKEGKSLQEIAEEIGYSNASGAWQAIQSALATTVSEPSVELRELELQRLDMMWERVLPKIKKGVAAATLAGIHIVQQRARLLGLYAPKKVLIQDDRPEGMSDEELVVYCAMNGHPILPGLIPLVTQLSAAGLIPASVAATALAAAASPPEEKADGRK